MVHYPRVMEVAGKRRAFTQAQQYEMRMALLAASTQQEYRRFAILLAIMTSDRSLSEIAREFGVSESMANHLIRAYRTEGLTGIAARKKGGNHRNMSFTEEMELLEGFRSQLEKGELVDVSEIHGAYERRLGRSVSKSVVYYVLARHKWPKKSGQDKTRKNQSVQHAKDGDHSK